MRLLLFSLLVLVSPVFAFPSLLSLDGYLTNSSGAALNGSFSFVFSLYNVSSGGSALWTETQTVTVSSGRLNALLGSVTALDLPFDQDYYLGVKVGADSEMSPRYRIASSAYAYTAKNLAQDAAALGGLKFGDTSSACDFSTRGMMKYVSGGSGVADSVYQCMKKGSDAYSWIPVERELGISATGGVITEVGGYRIHTFTSSGTFTVMDAGNVEVLVVAGGGGGGGPARGAGGGAGGLIYRSSYAITAKNYSVTVGAGGARGTTDNAFSSTDAGANGGNSVFDALTAIGGGGGGGDDAGTYGTGRSGGSGGGGWYVNAGGAGTAGQGNAGGNGQSATNYGGGGGGGAGAAGENGLTSRGGNGGNGLQYSISGAPVYYAGGGSADKYGPTGSAPGTPGLGGGGTGHNYDHAGSHAAVNTGGGGGSYGNGGSGIVIIRYPI